MFTCGIFIASLFGLICGWNKTSPTCANVFTKELNGDFTSNWIKVNSNCPENYTNQGIRNNCENFPPERIIAEDVFLFTIVHGSTSSDPYYNVYCAICNNETEFYYFSPLLTNLDDDVNESWNDLHLKDHDRKKYQVLCNLRMNLSNNELISIHDKIKYKFKMVRNLLMRAGNHSVGQKTPLSTFQYSDLNFCDRLESTNHRKFINLCDEISRMYETENYAPNETAFFPEVILPESELCKYIVNESIVCSSNRFLFKGVDFTYGENGDIFLMKNHSRYNSSLYTNATGMKNVIYFCNPTNKGENPHCLIILKSITSISRRMSLFFIIVYLFINSNHNYWTNLANRFTYSYYFTLLVMYIREEIAGWWPDEDDDLCFLKYYAYRYLSQSYSIWILICSGYVWYIVRFSKAEITTETRSRKSHLKIYLTACLFGWILPVISSLIFYHLEPTHSCPLMEGYTSLRICQRLDYKNSFYWFVVIVMLVTSVTVVALFADACYCYYYAKSIHNRYCKFNTLRARLVFLLKIVYSIALYSILAINSWLNLSESVSAILTHLWAFHGTVIFFVYSFKMTVLKEIFKDKDEESEGDSVKVSARRKSAQMEVSKTRRNCLEND